MLNALEEQARVLGREYWVNREIEGSDRGRDDDGGGFCRLEAKRGTRLEKMIHRVGL